MKGIDIHQDMTNKATMTTRTMSMSSQEMSLRPRMIPKSAITAMERTTTTTATSSPKRKDMVSLAHLSPTRTLPPLNHNKIIIMDIWDQIKIY